MVGDFGIRQGHGDAKGLHHAQKKHTQGQWKEMFPYICFATAVISIETPQILYLTM